MSVDILRLAEIASAVLILGGLLWAVFKWVAKVNNVIDEMKSMKEEDTLMCYALHACLDGLEQLGANHTVPVAKDKLEKHLNVQAHK